MRTDRLAAIDADVPEAPAEHPTPAHAPALRRRAAEAALGAIACWLAAAMFAPVFGSLRRFAVPTVAAAAGALIVSLLAGRRNLALRWALVLSAVAAALFVSYTVLVGSLSFGVVPGADTISGLRRGVGDGFAQMLETAFPIGKDTFPLVFVTLCTWASTAAATELTRRTRLASAPVLAPVLFAGLAMPVVGPHEPPPAWHVGAFLAVCLVLVLVRAVPDPKATGTVIGPKVEGLAEFHSRSLLSARLSLGVPIIVAVAVLAPVLGAMATTRKPADPRSLRDEIVEVQRVSDPLGEYKRIVGQSPARPAFQVQIEGATAQEVGRVAIVRLDAYDGVRFGTTDRYEPVGSSLIPAADRPTVGRDITLRFDNTDLDAPWLPTGAVPLRTDLRGVSYAPASGDLLASGTVKGLSYDVRARLVTPTLADLAAAGVDLSPDADPYRSLPGGLPPSLGRVASEATQGAANAADALDKLTAYLRAGFALDTAAPAGHTAGRLEQFLRVDRRGSPEQFAASFAVMARTLGYPTRVVVGYKLTADDAGQARALEYVTSASYHAWVEVRFNGLGWIAYDPTPATATTTPPTPGVSAGSPDTVTPTGGAEQRTPRELGPSEADLADPDGSHWLRAVAVVAGAVGAVALVVLLVVGAIVGAKTLRRRRRRRRASTADRVVGAWDEVVDRLVELHLPISTSMTPRDITALTRTRYGTAATLPLSFLVPDVGRAVFGPTAPGEEVADRAWARALEFEQNLTLTLNRRQRWQARLSLRPLRELDDGTRSDDMDRAARTDVDGERTGTERSLETPDPLDTPAPSGA